jgi:hypothetical protein
LLQIKADEDDGYWDLPVTLFWIKYRIFLSENIVNVRANYFPLKQKNISESGCLMRKKEE